MTKKREGNKSVWHERVIICPLCEKPITIMRLSFRADGKVRVDGICIHCNQAVIWESDVFNIVGNCRERNGDSFVNGNTTIH